MKPETSHHTADDDIEKLLNALLIVFHELGVTPEQGEKTIAEAQMEVDANGLFRYVFPNHFLYTLSEQEIKQFEFDVADGAVVIPIVDDRYFVVAPMPMK